MERTIEEWLSELPDGYRERALKNRERQSRTGNDGPVNSLVEAILGAFEWDNTPEKSVFWIAVKDHYGNGSPLPPLPDSPPLKIELDAPTNGNGHFPCELSYMEPAANMEDLLASLETCVREETAIMRHLAEVRSHTDETRRKIMERVK